MPRNQGNTCQIKIEKAKKEKKKKKEGNEGSHDHKTENTAATSRNSTQISIDKEREPKTLNSLKYFL